MRRAERQHRLPLRLGSGDADDPLSGDQRQLHRRAADPAGRGMDEHGARLDAARGRMQQVPGDLII